MKMYQIYIERAARKKLNHMDAAARSRLEDVISSLAYDPRPAGAIKLSGLDAYRIRIGSYRIVYVVSDVPRRVTVTNAGHRQSIYREL